MSIRPRDIRLVDALDARAGVALNEIVWRVAREGRDPTDCSASGGRWDDATFEVLYTSRTRKGALSEMLFHLRAGQPIVPSKLRFSLHELRIALTNALDLSTFDALEELGYDPQRYGRLSYFERTAEYPRTQEIAEVARFHGHDGVIVPSARSTALNVVIFCNRIGPAQADVIRDHGLIDWNAVTHG